MGASKKKRKEPWYSTPIKVRKFNVDGVAQGKPVLASMGGVLRNHKGEVLYMFSKHFRIKDSNEIKVLVILEALCIYFTSYQHSLIVVSGSFNAISWVKSFQGPWKMQFLFNKIHRLASLSQVSFQHISRSTNGMTDSLAKQGVD